MNYHKSSTIDYEFKIKDILKKLPSFCKDFIRHIEPVTEVRTRLAYISDIQFFFNYLVIENINDLDSIKNITIEYLNNLTSNDFYDYLEYLKLYKSDGKIISNDNPARKRKLISIRALFKHLLKQKLINNPSIDLVSIPKLKDKTITTLDENEIKDLLNLLYTGNGLTDSELKYYKKTKYRDIALFTLLLGTGIRVSECVGLNISDIDFNNMRIRIIRKGGNEAFVYFGEDTKNALFDITENKDKNLPLFVSLQGTRMTVRSIEKLVKKYCSKISIKKISPHKLRSTFGTSLYNKTVTNSL